MGSTVISRKDSMGKTHKVFFHSADTASLSLLAWAGVDSVQVSSDRRFKIGDLARPTNKYMVDACQGSVPLELVSGWGKGFKIVEIGPEGFPYAGHHSIELEGCEMLFLSTLDIESVKQA